MAVDKIHTEPSDPATIRAMEKLEKQFAEQDKKIAQKGGPDEALKQAMAMVNRTIQRHGEATEHPTGRPIAEESAAVQGEAAKVQQMLQRS